MSNGSQASAPDPTTWLLQWSSDTYSWSSSASVVGQPWGDGSAMANRQSNGQDPWDTDCLVTPLINGDDVMRSMRKDLEAAISEAAISGGAGGHVYIAGWRLNMVRDLSDQFATTPWTLPSTTTTDETAVGFVLRLMQAGISVRILVWEPIPGLLSWWADFEPHVLDHFRHFAIVSAENQRLAAASASSTDIGVFGLDLRTARSRAASHHQKFMVIRTASVNVAYCGGVDLAFTRRSSVAPAATSATAFAHGDWQSGNGIQDPDAWPQQASGVVYESVSAIASKAKDDPPPGSDLPVPVYGASPQFWHDQTLRFEGPFVSTLESAFCERWCDTGNALYAAKGDWVPANWRGVALFSGANALVPTKSTSIEVSLIQAAGVVVGDSVVPLPEPAAATVPSADSSQPTSPYVQLWRTIPYRKVRFPSPSSPNSQLPPFTRGEFTVEAGVSNAIAQSTELIWIFDQYFWSRPMARQLNAQLTAQTSLYVIVILPPHADVQAPYAHWARSLAVNDLRGGDPSVSSRVGVYDLWQQGNGMNGIYCHCKVHMYDDQLLVCGSPNVNRRSQLCDTEIAAAVLDPTLVQSHHARLLSLLVSSPPTVTYEQGGWGKTIFTAIDTSATALPNSNVSGWLIKDPWDYVAATTSAGSGQTYTVQLPNGATGTLGTVVSQLGAGSTLGPPTGFDWFYEKVMSPTSLPAPCDGSWGEDWSLDEIVSQLESTPNRPWEKA
jgi:phosphatidylserine/phosphatidylglycerophosphate/cardiolipin synthase-like enzyme